MNYPPAVIVAALSLSGLVRADCKLASDSDKSTPASHQLFRNDGYQSYREGQYEKAVTCYMAALQAAEARVSQNSITIAGYLNDLAIIFEELGRYGEARKYLERELDLLKSPGPRTGVAIGQTHMELGALSLVEGSLPEGERHYKKALILLTRYAGPEDARVAKAMSGLGRLYAEWGKFEQASGLLRNARIVAEKSMQQGSPGLIILLDSEAALFSQMGRYAEAEKQWLSALKIAEQRYGGSGLQYSALLLHMGQLYTEIHDYPSAEASLARGLAATEKASGADVMDRAILMTALGNAYLQQRKLAQAEPLFAQSTQILDDRCESVPLACAVVRSYLGDYYMVKRNWQAAQNEYEQGLKLRENKLGQHPLVAASLCSMAESSRKLKRKKEAKSYMTRAQEIMSLPGNLILSNSNQTVDVRSFRAANGSGQ